MATTGRKINELCWARAFNGALPQWTLSGASRLHYAGYQMKSAHSNEVAVGTTIADRPPHRSVRARRCIRLLPWMSGGEPCLRVRVQNSRERNPAL
jgi:hypothetical protein